MYQISDIGQQFCRYKTLRKTKPIPTSESEILPTF
jgi:hypothetical protein